ncbi:MAG: hypothetical protein JNL82_15255 [Myxococcales bacterium]|nr:hypothetical protein [Myxococcales bacterium]
MFAAACGAGNSSQPAERKVEAKVEAKNVSPLISQEDRELLEKMKAREKARADLNAEPSRFIKPGKWDFYDKGIINSYTRATAIEFTNTTEFDVRDMHGKITYIGKDDRELATVPFSAKGELRAGQTAKLKVEASEITGSAHKGKIHIERLSIDGSV